MRWIAPTIRLCFYRNVIERLYLHKTSLTEKIAIVGFHGAETGALTAQQDQLVLGAILFE